LLLFPIVAFSQPKRETKAGALLSFELEKKLSQTFSLNFAEEVRFQTNNIGFDRNILSLGADYSFWEKRFKAGAYYAFLYLYNNDYRFEMRNRFYANLSFKHSFTPINLSWRGRIQATLRDENRGNYKVNPRYVLKNKVEIEYEIWGKPFKPYLSCDLSINLNDPVTRYDPTRLRFQLGTTWRINRTDYLDFFLRYDEYLKNDDPRVFSIGVGYKMKL
jgi:hypothetical protein